ncbi:MAG TPA: hypothetical protein PKW35_15725, partial [Nannocystaceae bacterium]|nr:hypothetical protein [Nannocystaceae bacterium]
MAFLGAMMRGSKPLFAFAGALVVAAACHGDDHESGTSSTSTSTSTTDTSTSTTETSTSTTTSGGSTGPGTEVCGDGGAVSGVFCFHPRVTVFSGAAVGALVIAEVDSGADGPEVIAGTGAGVRVLPWTGDGLDAGAAALA